MNNNQLEKEVEKALVRMVKERGGYCLKWVCPGWSGVPDRLILLPGARVIFAEVKRPKGGILSKLQLKWLEKLGRLGFTTAVVWNKADVEKLSIYIDGIL